MHFLHQFQNHWSSWNLNSGILMARPSFTQLMIIFSHVYRTEKLAVQEYISPFKFYKYTKQMSECLTWTERGGRLTCFTVMPWKIGSNSDTVYLTVSFPSMYCIKHFQWLILHSARAGHLWKALFLLHCHEWNVTNWYSITSVALLGNWK